MVLLKLLPRCRRSTLSLETASACLVAAGLQLLSHGRRSTWSCFCVASAAVWLSAGCQRVLGRPSATAAFTWQAQHALLRMQHLVLLALPARAWPPLGGMRCSWRYLRVTGAAFGPPEPASAWQAQHFELDPPGTAASRLDSIHFTQFNSFRSQLNSVNSSHSTLLTQLPFIPTLLIQFISHHSSHWIHLTKFISHSFIYSSHTIQLSHNARTDKRFTSLNAPHSILTQLTSLNPWS